LANFCRPTYRDLCVMLTRKIRRPRYHSDVLPAGSFVFVEGNGAQRPASPARNLKPEPSILDQALDQPVFQDHKSGLDSPPAAPKPGE
jgi:hypothetical protein